MRNFFCNVKWDKKYLLAFIIVLICSIISGIVLCIVANISNYLYNFAEDYVYYVFNFKSGTLFFGRLFSSLIYFYIFFLLAKFNNLKYLTLLLCFIKGVFLSLYAGIIFGMNVVGGGIVVIFVFLPSTLISLVLCYLITEIYNCFGKFSQLLPVAAAAADGILLLIFVNVIFRVIIAIV